MAKKKFFQVIANNFSSVREIADATLAIQFGIKPLVSDVFQSVQGVAKLLNEVPKNTILVKSKGQSSDIVTTSYKLDEFTYTYQVETVVATRYTLQYRVSDALRNELSQWGLINPAEIAWETLPWSFAIDWIYPIGAWISSLTSDAGLEFVRGVKVVTTTITFRTSTVGSGRWVGQYRYIGQEVGCRVHEYKVRTLISVPPSFVPQFKNPFSLNHVVDSIALLTQKLRS
jgi:hypothetical protein